MITKYGDNLIDSGSKKPTWYVLVYII